MNSVIAPSTFESPVSVQRATALSGHKLLLHKDDYHQIPYVVVALKRVVGVDEEKAVNIATTAFTEGTALVITCSQEVAEHYQEQLVEYGLNATVE